MGVRPNVELSIERLILHGLDPTDGHGLRAAVEAELVRLIAEEGLPPRFAAGGEVARLPGGVFEVPAGAKPAEVAAQVARAVYSGMGGGRPGVGAEPGTQVGRTGTPSGG
ncbi:MAG TPA: hypothetical protein VHG28_25265 [Longimicrobiaceae bacterium]|nr:hypothetical protein [Longimicrobiaceae bacterium]